MANRAAAHVAAAPAMAQQLRVTPKDTSMVKRRAPAGASADLTLILPNLGVQVTEPRFLLPTTSSPLEVFVSALAKMGLKRGAPATLVATVTV